MEKEQCKKFIINNSILEEILEFKIENKYGVFIILCFK